MQFIMGPVCFAGAFERLSIFYSDYNLLQMVQLRKRINLDVAYGYKVKMQSISFIIIVLNVHLVTGDIVSLYMLHENVMQQHSV